MLSFSFKQMSIEKSRYRLGIEDQSLPKLWPKTGIPNEFDCHDHDGGDFGYPSFIEFVRPSNFTASVAISY